MLVNASLAPNSRTLLTLGKALLSAAWLYACSGTDDSGRGATTTSNAGSSSSTSSSTSAGTSTDGGPTTATSTTSAASTSTGGGGTSGSSTIDAGSTTSTTGDASTTGATTDSTTTTTTAGTTGSGGSGGASSTTAESTTTGGAIDPCPADASFCTGFEDGDLPQGAVYKLNGDPATPWTADFELDSTQAHLGGASLHVRPNSEGSGAYKMLAVPTPGAAFWVRFYLRSDVELGQEDHNVYAYAAGSDEPNDSVFVEFAEDVGLAFNSHDIVRWPADYGRLDGGGTNPYTLPADTWHCIEVFFDGDSRVQQLFVEGTQLIDAQDFPDTTQAFTTFKFGYNSLHGTVRNTWYDDVAVASARIGCL